MRLAEKFPLKLPENNPKDYYFCTGLDLYILEEPCIMCAMALSNLEQKSLFIYILMKNNILSSSIYFD